MAAESNWQTAKSSTEETAGNGSSIDRHESALVKTLKHYLSLHLRNCGGALADLRVEPVTTSLTVAVIGVALALPASLHLLVQNGQAIVGGWESMRDFSVYLKVGASLENATAIAGDLAAREIIDSIDVISADEALEQFRSGSGLKEVLDTLDGNPLPHTLVARPTEVASPEALTALEQEIRALPGVDQVRIDTEWVARLNAILDFLRRGVLIAAVILIGAVIVTVGNTIRLDIQNRRGEIEICKLLGASNGFVRRPFLYIGLWYGMIGGVFALLLLGAGYLLLAGPLQRLTGLYSGRLEPLGVDWATLVAVLAGGILCGWGGAWSAVSRHLAAIEPT